MKTAIVFDCEYLVNEDAPRRFWCGPYDPDPVVAQIGAVRLGLQGDFPVLDTMRIHVQPVDRYGRPYALDPFFVEFTGITDETLRTTGVPLGRALAELEHFSGEARLWSWGKDELNMMAVSCYIAGVQPPSLPVGSTMLASFCWRQACRTRTSRGREVPGSPITTGLHTRPSGPMTPWTTPAPSLARSSTF